MASFFQSLKFYFKATIFGLLIITCALYGVIASIILRLVGKKEYSQYTVARAFYYSARVLLGIKITVNNEKYLKDKPGIFISNHQSALDIMVLGKVFQPGFTVTAKKALKYFPFLGWFMLASGTFFIDRAKSDKARKVLNDALKVVKTEKRGLFMFPEGTRSGFTKLDMLSFKKGAFHLAQQAELPVVPIVVSNTSNIFHAKTKTFNTGEIIIDVLPPVPTNRVKTKEDVDNFVVLIREQMIQNLQKIGYSKTSGNVSKKAQPEPTEPSTPVKPIDSDDSTAFGDSEEAEIIPASEDTPLVN